MNTKPIIFSADMIRALLREIEQPGAGKTQTRRILKPQPPADATASAANDGVAIFGALGHAAIGDKWRCPYGNPGDLLYVRESIRIGEDLGADWEPWFVEHGDRFVIYPDDEQYIVPLDYEPPHYAKETFHGDEGGEDYWRSWDSVRSIHMPRWASRITLHLADVRVERIQDISEADARSEGMETEEFLDYDDWQNSVAPPDIPCTFRTLRSDFQHLWDSINAKRGYAWSDNPWVWALTFRPILANVDDVLADPGRYGIEVPA